MQLADRAQRAAGVRALHDLALASRATSDDLEQRHAASVASLGRLLGVTTPDDAQVAEHHRTATRVLDDLARVRPLRRQVTEVASALRQSERSREELAADLDRLATRAAQVPQSLADLEPRLASAREAVLQVATLDRELVAIWSRVLAARSADDLAIDLAAAQRDLAVARGRRLLLGAAVVLGEELEVGRLRSSGTGEVVEDTRRGAVVLGDLRVVRCRHSEQPAQRRD